MALSRRTPLALILSASLLGLTACASAVGPEKMTLATSTATPASASTPGYRALVVGEIVGGSATNPLWLPNVSDQAFHSALEASLRNLNYLADQDHKGAYVVTARIVDLDRPSGARDPVLIFAPVDWAVTAKIQYTVTPARGGPPVFDELVAATGSTGSGGLTAADRVRRASEAAIQANIASFLERLSSEWKPVR